MPRFKRTAIIAFTLLMTTSSSMPLHAAESSLKVIFEDTLYGGLIGSVLGAATLVFTENSSDHLENIAYGAAAGVFAGAGYGIATTSSNRAMVEYDNGKIRLAVPKVMPDIQESSKGEMVLAVKADLLRGTF